MQDFSPRLSALRDRLDEASGYLRIEQLTARRPQLEAELGRPDLWDDAEAAQAIQREFAELEDDLTLYTGLSGRIEDLETLAASSTGSSSGRCSPVSTTSAMPSSTSTPAPAGSTPRTGPRCCSACTCAGPSAAASTSSSTR
jgi:hypothetical protein